MYNLSYIQNQLGPMTWPLGIMSFVGVVIIAERILFLAFKSRGGHKKFLLKICQMDANQDDYIKAEIDKHKRGFDCLFVGLSLLIDHKELDRNIREEIVSVWLAKQRKSYTSGLRLLAVIGLISPLIGLLGTVLGLIQMFQDLASTSGSIAPSDLAGGLGLAMSTTAAGLIIALPAITCAQLLNMWADRLNGRTEHLLNNFNLYLEGIQIVKSKLVK